MTTRQAIAKEKCHELWQRVKGKLVPIVACNTHERVMRYYELHKAFNPLNHYVVIEK